MSLNHESLMEFSKPLAVLFVWAHASIQLKSNYNTTLATGDV